MIETTSSDHPLLRATYLEWRMYVFFSYFALWCKIWIHRAVKDWKASHLDWLLTLVVGSVEIILLWPRTQRPDEKWSNVTHFRSRETDKLLVDEFRCDNCSIHVVIVINLWIFMVKENIWPLVWLEVCTCAVSIQIEAHAPIVAPLLTHYRHLS